MIVNDPLIYLKLDKIKLNNYKNIPSIGFCGQVDSNFGISSLKILDSLWSNISFYFKNKEISPNLIYPPTTLRKKVLDKIEKSEEVKTNLSAEEITVEELFLVM